MSINVGPTVRPTEGTPAAPASLNGLSAGPPTSILLGISSGVLLALSLPKPDLHPLAWVALVPLLVAIARTETYSTAVAAGYSAGFAFFAGTFYWITETMIVYGGLNPGAAFGVGLLFVAVYALFFAAFGVGLHFFVRCLCIFRRGFPGRRIEA